MKTEKVLTKIVIFPHLILMMNLSAITFNDFIFNIFSGFLFQFEACMICCFHA